MMNWLLPAFSASFLPLTRIIFCSSQTQSLQILKFCLYFYTQTFAFNTCFALNGLPNFLFLFNSDSSFSTWLPPGNFSLTHFRIDSVSLLCLRSPTPTEPWALHLTLSAGFAWLLARHSRTKALGGQGPCLSSTWPSPHSWQNAWLVIGPQQIFCVFCV